MEKKEKRLLHLRVVFAILRVVKDRKVFAKENKAKGIKDHKLVYGIRKFAGASGIDYGTVQKITKGDQGLEFLP